MVRRRLGRDRALALARADGLDAALSELARTAYGHEVHPGMDLRDARHAVSAVTLWHLRVLAGWGPALGAGRLRALVAGFEVANISGHLAALEGRDTRQPFELGSMAGVWPLVARAPDAAEVRRVLTASPWGDPGTEEFAAMRIALRLAWARRVAEAAPEAGGWAAAWAALAVARSLAVGARLTPGTPADRDVAALLGSRWRAARSATDLRPLVPLGARWVLTEAGADLDGEDGLWVAEARWWRRVEADAARLAASARPDPAVMVGVAGLLGADAWRVRAALELAARGGGPAGDVLDAVA